ncbi:unnamed protein product [Urochloa decumbens]|uniref:F-box domain-containing protein n=1 Tax=Urochloa decumbens TaxID=240449 RepID=A0ABC9FIM3_9POAL
MMQLETTRKRAGVPTGAVDRLSALPDALLHAILFFLPSPQVVRTCVLSQRWRHLWRSTPCIKINEQDFGFSAGISNVPLEERWARFEGFATNLLLSLDNTSPLDEFCLCSRVYNQCHVDRWIRRGIEYCPAVLHVLIVGRDYRLKLPAMASSSFHRLKRLHLLHVDLDGQFADLLPACPVMEDLDLKGCKFSGDFSQGMTSFTLKKLALNYCKNNTSRPLVITAPSLSDLDLTYGCYQAGIMLSKMDFLVGAMIEITENLTLSQSTRRGLLGSLFNVTSLELSGFEARAKAMLNSKSNTLPIFCNMRTLCLNCCFLDECELSDKLEALGCFLQKAPCLEELTLSCSMFLSSSDSEWETGRKNITLRRQDRKTFQCHKLKLIKVMYDHDQDHRLIELVWRLGRTLPDVNIELTKEDD